MNPVRSRSGFTLVEILVVLVMLGFLMVLATPSFVKLHEISSLRASARTLLSTFQFARSVAVSRQTEVRIVFSKDRRAFHIETLKPVADSVSIDTPQFTFARERTSLGRERRLPVGIEIEMTKGISREEEWLIAFHPNGSADDVVLTLKNRQGRKLFVAMSAVTGRAVIESDPARLQQLYPLEERI